MTIGLQINLTVEFALLLAVENRKIDSVLKGLQRRSDRRVRIH